MSSGLPKPIEEALLARLYDEARHQMDLNAATGYQLDRRLPAPEVFERPGWTIWWAPPGACQVEVAIAPEHSWLGTALSDHVVRMATDVVRPLFSMDADLWLDPGVRYWFGLGVHVPSRAWVVFHSRRARPED